MNQSVVILFGVIFISGNAWADSAQCEDNFSVEGNFFSGKIYKSWAEFAHVKTNLAYKKVYAYTAKGGWQISQADTELGVISASQNVSYGNGKTAPLNILVEKSGSGSKVSMTYSTSGGITSPEDAVKKHFCVTLAEVDKK